MEGSLAALAQIAIGIFLLPRPQPWKWVNKIETVDWATSSFLSQLWGVTEKVASSATREEGHWGSGFATSTWSHYFMWFFAGWSSPRCQGPLGTQQPSWGDSRVHNDLFLPWHPTLSLCNKDTWGWPMGTPQAKKILPFSHLRGWMNHQAQKHKPSWKETGTIPKHDTKALTQSIKVNIFIIHFSISCHLCNNYLRRRFCLPKC